MKLLVTGASALLGMIALGLIWLGGLAAAVYVIAIVLKATGVVH